MLINRFRILRFAIVTSLLAAALTLAPTTMAGVRVGFNVNFALPPGVHVTMGNYDPYYVGRVFYQPFGVWRQVYSFPVQTPYGVVYQPYVYQDGRVVCQDYIPGFDAGYGQVIIEGRGYYNPQWRRPVVVARGHANYNHGWDNQQHRGWDRGGKHDDRSHARGHGNNGNHGRN